MRKILPAEHVRLKKLYDIEVFRASFLDFLVSEKGLPMDKPDSFYNYLDKNDTVLNNLGQEEFLTQINFLMNLGLIEKGDKKIILTTKGIDYVERGVFWERMKTLATEVRNFKMQLITLIVTFVAAGSALSTLILKILDN